MFKVWHMPAVINHIDPRSRDSAGVFDAAIAEQAVSAAPQHLDRKMQMLQFIDHIGQQRWQKADKRDTQNPTQTLDGIFR